MVADMADSLQHRLKTLYPAMEFALRRYPSAGWMLDIRLGERFFVVDFSPTRGFGFDEIEDEEGLDSSFTRAASGLDDLLEKLAVLVGSKT
ncbi:MAG: hypothetical protein ABW321_11465 [Polyangiales bacterium]